MAACSNATPCLCRSSKLFLEPCVQECPTVYSAKEEKDTKICTPKKKADRKQLPASSHGVYLQEQADWTNNTTSWTNSAYQNVPKYHTL